MGNRKNLKKSLGLNATLNMLKTLMGMLFPLITYPYIARVLKVDNIGKFNFSNSIVGYFSLFAAYGIATYAVREGAKIRTKKEELQNFGNDMFTINMVTTLISYVVLGTMLLFSNKLEVYRNYIIILSISILFITIGTDWINTIYEDFIYITLRTIMFQVISLILLFIFVRSKNDLYAYVWITMIASAGASLCNMFYCRRKYLRVSLHFSKRLKRHIKPMAFIFFSNLTTTIFVNSDQTMLGIMCGDYNVGLYAIAVKIYSVVKNIFTAVLIVAVPRISYMQTNDTEKSRNNMCTLVAEVLIVVVLPMSIGLFLVSDKIVMLIGGIEYINAIKALKILSISILCAAMASFMTYMIVVPSGKENILLLSSTISAISNVGLNFFMIPLMKQDGAAITTVISEFLVFIVEFSIMKPKLQYRRLSKTMIQVIGASSTIVVANYFVRMFMEDLILSICLIIGVSTLLYLVVLFLFQNTVIKMILNKCKLTEKG